MIADLLAEPEPVPRGDVIVRFDRISAEHCRQRAEECFQVARRTKDEGLRKQYHHLGHCYLELADAAAGLRSDHDKAELSRPEAAPRQQQRGDGSSQ